MLKYVETKDNKENINNIKYYENIQKKLNDLCFIITSLSQITSEKFTIKDYELENTFKKCIENIDKVQDVIMDKINFMYRQEDRYGYEL